VGCGKYPNTDTFTYTVLEEFLAKLFIINAELADAADSKSADLRVFGGSTPPPGTIIPVAFSITYVFNCIERIAMARWRKIPTVAALQFSNDTRTTDVLVTGL
jgi:hypothetical protein